MRAGRRPRSCGWLVLLEPCSLQRSLQSSSLAGVVVSAHTESSSRCGWGREVCWLVGRLAFLPGHPLVRHQSSSSITKHCSQENAPLASPLKTSSRSKTCRFPRSAFATRTAWRWISSTGRMRAYVMSRWRSQASLSSRQSWQCWSQKLQ